MTKTQRPLVLAALALAAPGCGGDDDEGAATAPSDDRAGATATTATTATTPRSRARKDPATKPVGRADVALTEFKVRLGKKSFGREGVYTLQVVNEGDIAHALEAEGPNGETETEEIEPGESGDLDAYLVSGTYELYCPIGNHRERGMTAKLKVGR